jgi:hypothetical protein
MLAPFSALVGALFVKLKLAGVFTVVAADVQLLGGVPPEQPFAPAGLLPPVASIVA